MKVLILHPDFKDPGGVAAYYRKLDGKFSIRIIHLIIGKRPGEHGRFRQLLRLIRDLRQFMHTVRKEDCPIVHLNPSLDPKSLIRDGMFVLAAKLDRRKILVFFRGWQARTEHRIQTRWRWLFKCVFKHADAFIVLSRSFEHRLESWVGPKPIYREYTALDDADLRDFDLAEAVSQRMQTKPWRILFISRLIREKGLYEAVDAARMLSHRNCPAELIVAGDGPELEPAVRYARKSGAKNVHFSGYVRAEAKTQLLRKSHLLCLPTYGEGFPNAVVECMGFGLPVITRPEGGIADFFQNGIHGFTSRSKDPAVFASLIRRLIENPELYRRISYNNYQFAQSRFKASKAAGRLEAIYAAMSNS